MRQGDFALRTNGEGVYRKDGAYFQCYGLTAARELHVRADHTIQPGAPFTPDPLDEVEYVGVPGDVVRENIDAQTDRVRKRMAPEHAAPYGKSVAQLVADGALESPRSLDDLLASIQQKLDGGTRSAAPRTLDDIVAAVRTNELVTLHDLRYAIVAFDVLMSQLHIDQNVAQLQEFFKAATTPPREYAGTVNDPENPEAVEWYKAMREVRGS